MSTLRVNNLKSRTGTAVTITSGHGLDVEGNLKITGVSTFSGITSFTNGANVTGVTTFEQASFAQNANFTGILTAQTFSGNIIGVAATFSGAVTYEDVTNVDSVGIVTAGAGMRIAGGGIQAVGLYTGFNSSGVATFANTVLANGWVSCGDTIALGDAKGIYFGADEDLSIYHDGTHSYIKDAGTGELKVHSDFFIIQNAAANETQLSCSEDGAVKLYYDNSLKLETTLTGAKTTGVSSCTSHCMPQSDVGGDLGSTTNRWANVYTADMQLSNEGSQNDIDGTWGKYTIQEGETDLFLINRRTGKKYKFMLEEVQ